MRWSPWLVRTAFLALGVPSAALAGANHIPEWSLASPEDVAKSVKTLGFATEGKAAKFPRKIAIPSFVIRYDKEQYDKDTGVRVNVAFADDAAYSALTDLLYDEVAKRFTDAGFEVVPRDVVMKSAAYQALEGEPGNDEGAERVRGLPTGMKDLGTKMGQPSRPNDLAALNRELGVDASVAVYANFGLCTVDRTVDTGMSGTKPCLRGNLTLPGLSMLFVGGAEGEGAAVKPAWTSRAYKQVVEFTYQDGFNGQVKDIYDAALISPLDASSFDPSGSWYTKHGVSDGAAYADGIYDMLDVAVTLAMETFYDKNADAMSAAGFARPAVAPAHPTARLRTREEQQAENAANVAQLDDAKARLAARPDGAPVAGGAVSCYRMPAEGAQNETILRRGFEAGRMVEESVAVVTVLGPVQNVATYTLGDGTFEAVDGKGLWTGTGTFEGPADAWTAWKSAIKVGTGATVDVTGTAEGTGLHIVTVVKGADGAVAATMDQHYAALDAAGCDAAWATALAYVAPPIGAPAAGKKPKKK